MQRSTPMTTSWLKDMLKGAAVSVAASAAMGAFMLLASRTGLLGEPPPRTLTRRILRRGKADALAHGPALELSTSLAHLGYGAAAGALFALLGRRVPSRVARVGVGLLYGTGVWGASYAGWIPAVGLMPSPSEDRPLRPTTMALAHWLFGGVLGGLLPVTRQARALEPSTDAPRTEAEELDAALDDSFPASDPPSMTQPHKR